MPKASGALFLSAFTALAALALAAAAAELPVSGQGIQTGAVIMGDKSIPKRPPRWDMGATAHITEHDPTIQPLTIKFTFQGAWFSDQPSVKAGENALEAGFQDSCGSGRRLTNVHFDRFHYTHTNFVYYQDFSASGINGSFYCALKR